MTDDNSRGSRTEDPGSPDRGDAGGDRRRPSRRADYPETGTSEDIRIDGVVDEFLQAKSKGRTNDTGTYVDGLELAVDRFLEFLETLDRPPRTFPELSDRHVRTYARHLDGKDLSDGSVLTYYANLSAFLGWCVREGFLDENPAQTDRAKEPLPDDDGRRSGDQPAWSAADRASICEYMDRQAESALDTLATAVEADHQDVSSEGSPTESESPALDLDLEAIADIPDELRARWDAIKVLRDRALVYLVGYTGVRGAEVLSHPQDERRQGARWEDLSIDDGRLTVFAKTQEFSNRAVPSQAHGALERYQRLLDPAPSWPLFPTMHRPSLYARLRERLHDEGSDDEAIESLLDEEPTFALYREHGVAPPPLTTNGARRILRRLTDDAGIDVDHPDHDYLTLHGARRGAGEAMVRARGYAAAARLLDNSERVVQERYSHIEAGELAEEASNAFDEADE